MSQDTLSPEQLYIVLRWDSAPALVAVGEGPGAHNQIAQCYPKARLIMSYPMLKQVLAIAQDTKVHEARPFGFKPTLHFCLTAQRGKDSAALVIKATSLKNAMRKAKKVVRKAKGSSFGANDISLVGTREELEHYLTQLEDALEHGKQIPIELDLRGGSGVLVYDGMGRLPADVHDLLDVMIGPTANTEWLSGEDVAESICANSEDSQEIHGYSTSRKEMAEKVGRERSNRDLPKKTLDTGYQEAVDLFNNTPSWTSRLVGNGPHYESLDEAVATLEKWAEEETEKRPPLELVYDYEWNPYTSAEVARRLIELGADPNARNDLGHTPLQALCESIDMQGRLQDVLEDELELAKALLAGGADPLLPMREGGFAPPSVVFPDLVEPWVLAASLESELPAPADTHSRGRL